MKYSLDKTYHLLTVIVLAGLMAGSCNKLIEIPPNPSDKVSIDRVFSDSLGVMSALVGIYMDFQVGGSGGTVNTRYLATYSGMTADELGTAYPSPYIDQLLNNDMGVENSIANDLWVTGYKGIYGCNAFLENVTGNTSISKSLRDQVTGEVLVARSLYYFNLVNLFGALPIITGTDYQVNARIPRSPADSVYTLIINDLSTAIQLLKVQYPSAGRLRPNSYTAKALLAKVYLYREQWQQAQELSNEILSAGLYPLTTPDNVFLAGNQEAIWEMASVSNYGQVAEVNYLVPYTNTSIPSYPLTDYLVNDFESGDLRKQNWVGMSTANGVDYYYAYKYKQRDINATPKENYMLFRAGEQYLIRAEASANLGMLDSARADINRIRDRAGLGATTAVTQQEVLDAIMHERRIELFVEMGNRWFDLVRTGRAATVLGPIKSGWESTDVLYPIPQTQMNNNPFLKQNPGYN